MGYDLYRVTSPDRNRDDEGAYFRLNVWGMGDARERLWEIGMVADVTMPPAPKLAEFGLTDAPKTITGDHIYWSIELQDFVDEGDEPVTPTPEEAAYLMACQATLDDPPQGDAHGIALYKLCSNDAWLVTPGEIITGVGWADAHHAGWRDRLEDYIRQFVEWMEGSVPGGGFRVY